MPDLTNSASGGSCSQYRLQPPLELSPAVLQQHLRVYPPPHETFAPKVSIRVLRECAPSLLPSFVLPLGAPHLIPPRLRAATAPPSGLPTHKKDSHAPHFFLIPWHMAAIGAPRPISWAAFDRLILLRKFQYIGNPMEVVKLQRLFFGNPQISPPLQ
ncbi:hypothetical protein EI94DRAFT_1716215 [Lactarius quietus]|nr:hypothetical protein EI94DRAFT_1716215 [Lactarius quietus]